ncbi:MAG: cobaltochelatase subunit CobN [Gallionella sp.]|nr:cobaltochelatase subunit CobN [Gallionella sp.]MDD4945984.1 cobaltochelatase subunit CobN [Gallionella sp.]
MYHNKNRIQPLRILNYLLAIILFACATAALAAPLSVSLMMGGNDTATAADAARLLKTDPALRDVKVRVYSMLDFPERATVETLAHAAALAKSNIIFVSTSVGRRFIDLAGVQIKQATQAGGSAYIVGGVWDADFASFGLTKSPALTAYKEAGGAINMANMVRAALAKKLNIQGVPEPDPFPETAYFNPTNQRSYDDFKQFEQDCTWCKPGKQWVAVYMYRNTALSGKMETVNALMASLTARGLNALPVYSIKTDNMLEKLLLDKNGHSRVAGVLALGGKFDMSPTTTVPLLQQMNVPVINLITTMSKSRVQFEASPIGLDIMERSWQVGSPELGGAIAPTIVATKERHYDAQLDVTYDQDMSILERVERATERMARYIELHNEMNLNKRVALIYYNYPPGKENVGASYLNVLPKSLTTMLQRLKTEGYNTGTEPIDENLLFNQVTQSGTNISGHRPGELEALVRSGNATLLPTKTYEKWFAQLPESLRKQVTDYWGAPDQAKAMLWRDAKGVAYFVFPTVRKGNILLTAQPDKIGSLDVSKLYHDVHIPPHHQYLAFYLWLQYGFKSHAMVHVGTHGTHEWHGGREVGYLADDPGEVFVGAVPQLYPYIVDNIGEGIQAKRRGMAALISYLTPALDKASLNGELVKLMGLISDYRVAKQKGAVAADAILGELSGLAVKLGVAKDLGYTSVTTDAQVDEIEDHLKALGEANVPYGLHTFGVSPDARARETTVDAMLSIEKSLTPVQRAAKRIDYLSRLERSGAAELDALVNGLKGGYIAASGGNDPIRNPDALPTGRNMFGFDATRLPMPATYAAGAKQAADLAEDYRKRHGQYPDKLTFNLWGVESYRHEGMLESEIMNLMGVKPVWDERGLVKGVELISRQELGRPRVDVVILPSGMYRDQFAPVMILLDKAATAARLANEADNPIAKNYQKTVTTLKAKGVPEEQAQRLAGVRIFSSPTGVYGNNVNKVVPKSNTWTDENQIADVYLNRNGNPYGQGYWGGLDTSAKDGQPQVGKEIPTTLGVDLFKLALTGVNANIHSRSSNTYAALDNDDFYDALGGAALAVRAVNGKGAETIVANFANPKDPHHESLEKFIGTEMRTRYLNPEWIKSMMKEGYSGARFIGHVTENLWGWQVTTPEAIDGAKWQEMYETYVADRNGLNIKQKFRDSKNMLAYQGMIDRMAAAINKGYWKADEATKRALDKANQEAIAEAGVACDRDSCSSQEITTLAEAQDRKVGEQASKMPAPKLGAKARSPATSELTAVQPQQSTAKPTVTQAAAKSPSSNGGMAGQKVQVDGYEMTEQKSKVSEQLVTHAPAWFGLMFAVMIGLGMFFRKIERG